MMAAPPPNMLTNMGQSSRPHSYYQPPPSTYVSPNIMLTHLPPPPTPSPLSTQPPAMLPSQQTYYQNSFATNTPPPLPVPYPHHTISELASPASTVASSTAMHTPSGHHQHLPEPTEATPTTYGYDYHHGQHQQQQHQHHSMHHQLHTPVDEIPIPSDEQAPTSYADSHHSYDSTAATSVTSAHEQLQLQQQQQLLQQLQQHQLLLQEQQQQEQEQQQEQQPGCTVRELKEVIAAAKAAATQDLSKLKLPPKWKAVRDAEGRVYYYHTKTRISQWYPPQEEPAVAAAEVVEQVEEGDYSSEDESSADEEDEVVETRKRRRSSKYDHVNVFAKRLHRDGDKDKEQSSFDVSNTFVAIFLDIYVLLLEVELHVHFSREIAEILSWNCHHSTTSWKMYECCLGKFVARGSLWQSALKVKGGSF